jgi:prolyl oligopeptidase
MLLVTLASGVAGAPPPTRVESVPEVLHGVEIPDPYRWLEEQDAPETRAWIEAQNRYTDALLGARPSRALLAERLRAFLSIDDFALPVPSQDGRRQFFLRRLAGQDLPTIVLRQGGQDTVLVDPHPWTPDHSQSAELLSVSSDGSRLVYAVRSSGQDEVEVRVLDVDARRDLADVLPRERYYAAFLAPARQELYYVRQTDAGPRLFAHKLGTSLAANREIFGAGYGPEKLMGAELSEDGRFLVVTVYHGSSADRTEIYVRELAREEGFRPMVNDIEGRFLGSFYGDRLYLLTTWQAGNGRVVAIDPARPAREHWTEVVPERRDAVLTGFTGVAGRLFLVYLENVRSRVVMVSPTGQAQGEIDFGTLGTVSGLSGLWQGKEAFVGFSSFHQPETIYRFDPANGRREPWAKPTVPFEGERYTLAQRWATSKDGTRVPFFVAHRKDLKLDGSHPTLLTGYGGFTVSLTPGFSAQAAAWLESGGVYAVANLRGGGELGEPWHQGGMLERKQNTFDDFIAVAENLITSGFTRPERLAVSGGSNGGLLVGAMLTQRPDLVRAVVCSYPLLDMLRYHRFLVAQFWVPEYGSAEDPKLFPVLRAYSPYHNLKPGTRYPATLLITGDGDTRVAPLHARKMAARLQAATDGERPVLLRYHVKAGHAGGQPVSQRVAELAETLSFLLWQLGVEAPPS